MTGWEFYDATEVDDNQHSCGFLGLWFGAFVFVIVLTIELALMNG
jgi:hypothetical protein